MKRMIISFSVLVVALALIVVSIILIVHHSKVKALDNYDAQMSLGTQYSMDKEYDKAEAAYLSAIDHRNGDRDANIKLAELYVLMDRPKDAANRYLALQDADETDVDIYGRLIDLYVNNLNDIPSANAQILKAYSLNLTLDSPLVADPPDFQPGGGKFNQVLSIKLSAAKGRTIHYTTKEGELPTIDSKQYTKPIVISSNKKTTISAISFDKSGLMSWPTVQYYRLKLEFAVDTSAVSFLGSNAGAIMGALGPLYYNGSQGGGAYYTDSFGINFYIFALEDFYDKATDSYLDPMATPLPDNAKCLAVSMPVSQYIVQQTGNFKVKDFMDSLKVKNYTVQRSAEDGDMHLYYDIGSARYDITLINSDTISTDMSMTVYLIY